MFGIDDLFFFLAGAAYSTAGGVNAAANRTAAQQYVNQMNYNQERQHQLEMMVDSACITDRKAFDELLGRVVDRKNWYEKRMAIKEIAEREGWRYFDPSELLKDPTYVKLIGGKIPDWKK